MQLITSDTILRQYITNTMVTVEGEITLFQKMTPELIIAESWFTQNVTPLSYITGTDLTTIASKVVACHAFYAAIPQLDLILTPNGFGIVSNDNVVPASKDRISSLRDSIIELRDNAIQALIEQLDKNTAWKASDGKQWRTTLFLGLDAQIRLKEPNKFDLYNQQLMELVNLESKIGYEYVSQELMTRLRSDDNLSEVEKMLRTRIQSVELEYLRDGSLDIPTMDACVVLIRNTPSLFAIWEHTPTADHYKDHTYQNDKSKGGFWI